MDTVDLIRAAREGADIDCLVESLFSGSPKASSGAIRRIALSKNPTQMVSRIYSTLKGMTHYPSAFGSLSVGPGRMEQEAAGRFQLVGPHDDFAGTIQIKVLFSEEGRAWKLIITVQGRKHSLAHPSQASERKIERFLMGIIQNIDSAYGRN